MEIFYIKNNINQLITLKFKNYTFDQILLMKVIWYLLCIKRRIHYEPSIFTNITQKSLIWILNKKLNRATVYLRDLISDDTLPRCSTVIFLKWKRLSSFWITTMSFLLFLLLYNVIKKNWNLNIFENILN